MKTELEAMEEVGLDAEEVRRGWAFMNGLQETGPEGRKNRLLFLRALAELARENDAARSIVEQLLDLVGGKLPEEAKTFRGYYLDGDTKPSARRIAERLFIDITTVHRHNKQILTAMLAHAFGIYGYFQTDRERETPQEAPGDHRETPLGTRER